MRIYVQLVRSCQCAVIGWLRDYARAMCLPIGWWALPSAVTLYWQGLRAADWRWTHCRCLSACLPVSEAPPLGLPHHHLLLLLLPDSPPTLPQSCPSSAKSRRPRQWRCSSSPQTSGRTATRRRWTLELEVRLAGAAGETQPPPSTAGIARPLSSHHPAPLFWPL